MAVIKPHMAYQKNAITTARPEELTLMLYSGLVKFIIQAKKAIEEKQIENAHKNLVHAQDIVIYLQATLDMNYDISKKLKPLYGYMLRRLVQANLKKDRAIADEMLNFAIQLRDTWDQAMKNARMESLSRTAASGGK